MKKFATGFLIFILCFSFCSTSIAKRYGADSYLQPRIPSALQTIFIFLLQMSNIRKGEGEISKKTIETDEQLEMLMDLITILEKGYSGDKNPYNKSTHGRIDSLKKFIELTEPLRVDTDSLAHDYEELMRMLKENKIKKPVHLTLEMVKNDETIITDNNTRNHVIRYLTAQRDQLMTIYKKGSSLSGMVFGEILGQTFAFANQAHKIGETVSTLEKAGMFVIPTEYFQSAANFLLNSKQGGLGLVTQLASDGLGNSLQTSAEALPSLVKDTVEKVKGITTFEDISLKMVEFFIKTKKDPMFQEQVIAKFEAIFNGLIEKFKNVGTRIADSPEIQKSLGQEKQAVTMLRTFELFLNEYPGKLPSDIWKTLLRVLVFSEDENATDITTFGRMADHFDPNFKNLLQFLAEYIESPELKEVLERQQSKGQTMPFALAKAEIEREAEKNGWKLTDIDPTPIGSGKSFTVYKGVYHYEESGEKKQSKVAIRIMLPDAQRKARVGQKILNSFASKIAEVLNRDPELKDSPIDAEVIKQIISVVTGNTARELNVPLTVRNQELVGNRWATSKAIKSNGRVILINFKTPKVFPLGYKESKMMISELVEDAKTLEDVLEEEGEVVTRAIGTNAFSLYVQQGILNPLLLKDKLEEELKENKKKDPSFVAPPALETSESHGALNTDLHKGNWLFKVKASMGAEYLEQVGHLARAEDEVLVVDAYMVDHGLDAWLTPEQGKALMTLGAAAEFNNVKAIASALWDLQDEEAKGSSNMDSFEKRLIAERKSRLENAVHEKAWELHRARKYWPISTWIKFSLKFLTLNPEIISVDRGSTAVSAFARSAKLKDSDLRKVFEAVRTPEIKKLLKGFLKEKIGNWGLFGLAREMVIAKVRGCAPDLALAGSSTKE